MGAKIDLSAMSDYTRARFDPEFARKSRLADFGVEEFHPGHQDQSVHGARNPTDATALADPTGRKKKDPISNAAKASGGKVVEKVLKAGTTLYTSGTTPLYTDSLETAKSRGIGDIVALKTTRDLKFLVHKAGSVEDADNAAAGAEYDGVVHPHNGEAPDYNVFVYENLAYTATIPRRSLRFESLPENWEEMSADDRREFVRNGLKPIPG